MYWNYRYQDVKIEAQSISDGYFCSILLSDGGSHGESVWSGNVRSDKGEDPADSSLSAETGDEEFSALQQISDPLDLASSVFRFSSGSITVGVSHSDSTVEELDDFDFFDEARFDFPCFCDSAKVWQMASSFASTAEWSGLYSPKSPPTEEPWCLRWGKLSLAKSPRSL